MVEELRRAARDSGKLRRQQRNLFFQGINPYRRAMMADMKQEQKVRCEQCNQEFDNKQRLDEHNRQIEELVAKLCR